MRLAPSDKDVLIVRWFLLAFALLAGITHSHQYGQGTKQTAQCDVTGTEKKPFIVKIAPTLKTKAEATREKEDHDAKQKVEERKQKNDDDLAKFTGQVADYTNNLFWIGAIQAGILLLTWIFIWRQEAATKSVERAYVFPEIKNGDGPIHTVSGDATWSIDVDFWNSGKTPAIIRKIRGYAHIAAATEPLPDDLLQFPGAENELAPGMAIPKDTSFPTTIPVRISTREWGEIERGNSVLYVMGRLEYDDVFRRRCKTGYCWQYRYHMREGKFIISQNTKLNYYT